jgi:hypothetical protein
MPFALVGLLWVGLGPPWVATAAENQMRYLVLILMASATAAGFVVLKEALCAVGERFYSTLGFAAIVLAGPLYLVWDALVFGAYFGKEHTGEAPPAIASLNVVRDLVLSLAGALTYLATAAFAASLGRVEWLSRRATRVYVIVSFVPLFFYLIRFLNYTDPAATSVPWYTTASFIASIPALPLIMPSLIGAVLLRRAGKGQA